MKKAICTTLSVAFLLLIMGTVPPRSVHASTSWTVTSTADTTTAVPGNCPHATDCRLRDAIAAASAGDTITFDPALAGQTIALSATLIIDKDLTLDGSALSTPIIISGDTDSNDVGDVRVFMINSDVIATLNSLTIRKGKATGNGGGINNQGNLSITNSSIESNSAGEYGGGIYGASGSHMNLHQVTISSNSADWSGGGIYFSLGELTIDHSTIGSNTASQTGGGIYSLGTLTLNNSTVSSNKASVFGGGGIFSAGALILNNSIVNGNTVSSYGGYGGGIHSGGTLELNNSTVSGNILNIESSSGGGIDGSGTVTITNSTISSNSAADGGGIMNNGDLIIINSTSSGNSAYGGGSIYNSIYGTLTIRNSTFSGNSAHDGGVIANDSTATVTNSTLFNNAATNTGGGIYNNGTLTITNSTVSNNSAPYGGGVLGSWSGSILNYANTIIANSAFGDDCFIYPYSTIGTNINNLVEDGSCSAALSGDPHLGTLADNGGPTQTIALLAGSPAINAGDNSICAAAPVNNLDQRGISRPEGSACEIGAYEVDIPVVASVKLLDPSPTAASSVDFQVTFSESVTGVDETEPFHDFALNSTGLTDAFITAVSGSEDTYTVTVNTGSGDGILHLEVRDDDSIVDASGNPLGGVGKGNGDYTDGEFYTINRTTLLSPANTETLLNNRPLFDWSDTSGASQYQIVVSKSSSFSTPLLKEISLTSAYTPANDLPAGRVLYWRARAKVGMNWGPWSETWSFMTARPPSIPVQVAPATGSLIKNYTPKLDWNNSTVPAGAAAFDHYEVQISLDKLFTDPVLIEEVTPGGKIGASSYTPTAPLAANTKYFWRARSVNVEGQYSSWSTVWSFRTALLPPSNLTPQGGETVGSRKPVLSWDTVDGAEGYAIQISTSNDFATPLVDTTVTTNTFTPSTKLPAQTTIYWRVRTTGTNGPSRWTTASFNTP